MSPNAIRLVRLLLILAVILLWEFYTRVFATSLLPVAPTQVLQQLWPRVLGEPNVRIAIGWTLFAMIVAFLMSVVFGMLIGVLVGLTNIGRRSFYPIVLLLYIVWWAIRSEPVSDEPQIGDDGGSKHPHDRHARPRRPRPPRCRPSPWLSSRWTRNMRRSTSRSPPTSSPSRA